MTDSKQSFDFPKSLRLRNSAEFARVYNGNIFAANHCLVIQGIPSPNTESKIGISVSRKVGNAVVRNRWKRLIREAFRLQKKEIPSGIEIVVRPKKGAEPQFESIKTSLIELTRRIQKKLERQKK